MFDVVGDAKMDCTRSQPAASSQSSLRDKMACAELTRADVIKARRAIKAEASGMACGRTASGWRGSGLRRENLHGVEP